MSESERRRGYRYNRVLIETERILDPQFDDALVFLTGAQIEMLRNVTQYLNRLDTYVSEQFLGYYLAPTVEEYDSILEIVADLEETLMGNPNTIWGYKDRYNESLAEEGIGAGFTYVLGTEVPEGKVYKLEHWSYYHTGGSTLAVALLVYGGTSPAILDEAPALADSDYRYENTRITLKEGDSIVLRVTNLPAETAAYLQLLGYIMDVP